MRLRMTSGRETWNSKPSRRICSIRMANCSSPRPLTLNTSEDPVASTRRLTLERVSRSQALFEVARGDVAPVPAGERRVVDEEVHRDRRLFDRDEGQRRRVCWVGDRLADVDVLHAGDGDDVARRGLGDLDALEAVEAVDLGDARVFQCAVAAHDLHRAAELDAAARDAADAEAPEVLAVVDGGDQHLEGRCGVAGRRRHGLQDRLEEGLEVRALDRPARAGRCPGWRRSRSSGSRAARRWRRARGRARRPGRGFRGGRRPCGRSC